MSEAGEQRPFDDRRINEIVGYLRRRRKDPIGGLAGTPVQELGSRMLIGLAQYRDEIDMSDDPDSTRELQIGEVDLTVGYIHGDSELELGARHPTSRRNRTIAEVRSIARRIAGVGIDYYRQAPDATEQNLPDRNVEFLKVTKPFADLHNFLIDLHVQKRVDERTIKEMMLLFELQTGTATPGEVKHARSSAAKKIGRGMMTINRTKLTDVDKRLRPQFVEGQKMLRRMTGADASGANPVSMNALFREAPDDLGPRQRVDYVYRRIGYVLNHLYPEV